MTLKWDDNKITFITELLNSNINSELLRNIKVSDVGLVL